jgi:hypothetical protein
MTLADLESLLQLLRRNGVVSYSAEGVSVSLGPLAPPAEDPIPVPMPAAASTSLPQDPNALLFWASSPMGGKP